MMLNVERRMRPRSMISSSIIYPHQAITTTQLRHVCLIRPPVFQAEIRIEVQGPCVSPFESRSQVRAAWVVGSIIYQPGDLDSVTHSSSLPVY